MRSDYKPIFLACLLSISTVFPEKLALARNSEDNPLLQTVERSDRLIPSGYGKRELTSFEKYRIEEALPELDRSAEAELKQGNDDEAFELWYRRLRLTRALNPILEIKALGEIGAIAWSENRGTDVRNIAERLIAIEEESTDRISSQALDKLATAYQQVRYLDKATSVYQQILVNSKQQDNPVAEQKNLETLGELYLARFNYRQAADVYQELLASTKSNEPKQATYLQHLADIYDRTSQPEKAIAVKQRLISQHIDHKSAEAMDLEIAIASDYKTSNQTDRAIEAYSSALKAAFADRKLASASDILNRLGEIYRENEQIDKATSTYNKLLELQQQTYNYYGMLDVYDTLGKMYLDLDKTQAKQYFQQGFDLAKSLDYKVEYFNNLLERANK